MACYVWDEWCDCTSSTTASTVWRCWTGNCETACDTTASNVWVRWSTNSATTNCRYYEVEPPKPLTPEEQERIDAERARRAEERRLAEEKRLAEKKAADEKAEKLLRSNLTTRQRRSFRKHKHFCVRAADGTRFRLKHGWAGNVEELDARGRAVNRYCIHPREEVPYADNLLAQKLLLETDPATFRRVANRTAIPQPAAH